MYKYQMKEINSYINEKLVINKDSKLFKVKVSSKREIQQIINDMIKKNPQNSENINLNHLDVSGVEDMTRLFRSYEFKTIDIKSWDVINVKTMSSMFPTTLESVDLSDWQTDSITSTTSMFLNCKKLKNIGDISNWNVTKLETAANMFAGCSSLESIDISDWKPKSLTNVSSMFANCVNLKSIGTPHFEFDSIIHHGNTFLLCKKLKFNK